MQAISALVFDVDGTLADTERDGHRVSFNAAFRDAGLDWDWSPNLYGDLLAITGGKERMRHYVERYRPDFVRPADFDGFIAGLHAAKTEHYTRLLARGGIPLRTGVRRLLTEARGAGLRLAIATTTTPANVHALLEHALAPDAASWFEVIAAGDIVPAKKPDPAIYHHALAEMGLRPEQCVAFEDSENGLRSALGAGLTTIVTVNDYTRDHDFSGAALVVSEMGEPEAPFEVLAGETWGARCVDLTLIRQVHGAATAPRAAHGG